jgi:hypothetical protein
MRDMTSLRFSGVKMSMAMFLVTGILDEVAREEWGKLRFACSPAVALLALPAPPLLLSCVAHSGLKGVGNPSS